MEFYHILPELFVLGAASFILLVDLFVPQERHLLTYSLTQLALIIAAILSFMQLDVTHFVGFNGTFIRDSLTTILEIAIYIATFVVFICSREYILDRDNLGRGEYYVLGLFSMLGMMVLVSAYSLVTIYLGLELLSLPLYAMVAMRRDDARATEAGIKYFIMGAIASGMLLYGMALLFGASDALNLHAIAETIANHTTMSYTALTLGVVFIVIGIAFKLGAAPFHMWVPDVYDGSPNSVTIFVGTAPKIAAFGMAIRLLTETVPSLHVQWQPLLILLAIASMGVGNVLAIAQTNIKRMLAYSGIAHIGYMTLGLIAATPDGYSSALFYILIYVFMSLAGFSMLVLLSRQGFDCENISDLQGLNSRSPWLALMMLLIMFSMAGIPPLVGFFAKVAVLEALIDVHMVWLTVVAIVFAIIGLYYYLRVVKVMYFDKSETNEPISWQKDMRVVISVNSLALLFFGIFPGSIFMMCHGVFLT